MRENFLPFILLFLGYIGLIGALVVIFFPLIQKMEYQNEISYKEGFKEGLQQVRDYKWNIALFALFASIFVLIPEITVDWPVRWSLNRTGSVVVFVLAWTTIVYGHLPSL